MSKRLITSPTFLGSVLAGATLSVAIGLSSGLLGGTGAYWSKPVDVVGAPITNGNLQVVSVGGITVTPGADSTIPGWGDNSTNACYEGAEVTHDPGETNTVNLGAYDDSAKLRFPVEFSVVGNNLVAVSGIQGSVTTKGEDGKFSYTDWQLVDKDGKAVSQVTSGTYYAQANMRRAAEANQDGLKVSPVGTAVTDSVTFEKVTVTLNQER